MNVKGRLRTARFQMRANGTATQAVGKLIGFLLGSLLAYCLKGVRIATWVYTSDNDPNGVACSRREQVLALPHAGWG
jgi:hypothetical protein